MSPLTSEVTVRGWVRTRRDSKAGISFLAVYDGSCFDPVQAVINNSLPNYQDDVLRLTTGCSVIVTGMVVASPGEGQSIRNSGHCPVEVTGWVEDPDTYPMAAKRHSIEYLREVAHLRPRTNLIGAVARVRHTLAQALHRFFDEQGYFWVSTPLITASDTEGAGEMFRVSTLDLENLPRDPEGKVDFDKDFFGKEAFLTVSGQLNGETYACALSKVYTFGPTFRAENSNTSRHLAEFWMLEPEVAFADAGRCCGSGGSDAEVCVQSGAGRASGRHEILRRARRQRRNRPSGAFRLCRFCAGGLHRRRRDPAEIAARSSRTRFTGALTSRPSTNAIWPRNISKRRWW